MKHINSILDVGCGNGWLSNLLAQKLSVEVCGVDINESDLTQAAGLFNSDHVSFAKLNIVEAHGLRQHVFDTIVMASSIQYFPSVKLLIRKLFEFLTPDGEIHIVDSPICYSSKEAEGLKMRSSDYFARMNLNELSKFYHYHTLQDLTEFDYKMLLNPKSPSAIISRRIFRKTISPYPWIKIVHKQI